MNDESTYEIRSLTDDDIPKWTEFCAHCFSYKPNPPPSSYFLRHYNNDPRRDASLIRVICHSPPVNVSACNQEESESHIVSSTRIFQKTLSLGSGGRNSSSASTCGDSNVQTIEAGGIGEVCTSANHRKKGLAKRLLRNAIDVMTNETKMHCSLLHASPQLTTVYEKSGGYVCVTSKWSVLNVPIPMRDLNGRIGTLNVRLASFPDDTVQLQAIHKKYSEERFAGCIIRSVEYWNEYLRYEIGESLFVLTDSINNDDNNNDGSEIILGWISIRPRNDRFQLRDFGVNLDQCKSLSYSTSQVLSRLLKVALEKEKENISTEQQKIELHLPTAIVDEMKDQNVDCEWVNLSDATSDDDIGWMYKMLQSQDVDSDRDIITIVNKLNVPHLIWPSDSF